jgi:hypothetical protein
MFNNKKQGEIIKKSLLSINSRPGLIAVLKNKRHGDISLG